MAGIEQGDVSVCSCVCSVCSSKQRTYSLYTSVRKQLGGLCLACLCTGARCSV